MEGDGVLIISNSYPYMIHEVRIEFITNEEQTRYERDCKLFDLLK